MYIYKHRPTNTEIKCCINIPVAPENQIGTVETRVMNSVLKKFLCRIKKRGGMQTQEEGQIWLITGICTLLTWLEIY